MWLSPLAWLADRTDNAEMSPQYAVWRYHKVFWRCVAHGKVSCAKCEKVMPSPVQPGTRGAEVYTSGDTPQYTGRMGTRANLSAVGAQSDAGIACPRCGSLQFIAKRSNKGKLMAGVLAPKTQVKCVACGMKFKRG
jgi:DNA-directed RNA polymerase subunit RPC12/RpoP